VRKTIRKGLNDPDAANVTKQNMDYRHNTASIQLLQQGKMGKTVKTAAPWVWTKSTGR